MRQGPERWCGRMGVRGQQRDISPPGGEGGGGCCPGAVHREVTQPFPIVLSCNEPFSQPSQFPSNHTHSRFWMPLSQLGMLCCDSMNLCVLIWRPQVPPTTHKFGYSFCFPLVLQMEKSLSFLSFHSVWKQTFFWGFLKYVTLQGNRWSGNNKSVTPAKAVPDILYGVNRPWTFVFRGSTTLFSHGGLIRLNWFYSRITTFWLLLPISVMCMYLSDSFLIYLCVRDLLLYAQDNRKNICIIKCCSLWTWPLKSTSLETMKYRWGKSRFRLCVHKIQSLFLRYYL